MFQFDPLSFQFLVNFIFHTQALGSSGYIYAPFIIVIFPIAQTALVCIYDGLKSNVPNCIIMKIWKVFKRPLTKIPKDRKILTTGKISEDGEILIKSWAQALLWLCRTTRDSNLWHVSCNNRFLQSSDSSHKPLSVSHVLRNVFSKKSETSLNFGFLVKLSQKWQLANITSVDKFKYSEWFYWYWSVVMTAKDKTPTKDSCLLTIV